MENIITLEGIVEDLSIQPSHLRLDMTSYRARYVRSKKFTCKINGYLLQGNFQELFFEEGSCVRVVTYAYDDVSLRHHIDALLNLKTAILHIPAWMGYGFKYALLDIAVILPILIWLSIVISLSLLFGGSPVAITFAMLLAKLFLILYFIIQLLCIPLFWGLVRADKQLLRDIGFSQNTIALKRIFYFRHGKFRFEHSYAEVYLKGKYCHGIHDCFKLLEVYPEFKLSDVYVE
ncbi:hypothetical protein QTA56_11880 [Acinetobacter sp. VNH17]|uniref:Uncharacterized protein n=1 Tax=Acinetobacter thutiue TaxID=2998078 RepID=A0ABT7WQF2_9GAMM|nr:hypothetical protein [Acinetobacter thutiue]MCY6412817.1 hypothetical protein [Acinetobacter thutiue]MDN0014924.1 hypothetical protein [Acinetobacter thutiue]